MPDSAQRRHIKHGTYRAAPTPYMASSAACPTVIIEWGDANQFGNSASIQLAQLGDQSNQHADQDRPSALRPRQLANDRQCLEPRTDALVDPAQLAL